MRFSSTLFFAAALGFALPLFSQSTADVDFDDKQTESDMDALRRWLNDKRMITVRELGGDLSISGDVRTEFQATNERLNGIQQRGVNAATQAPAYGWDIDMSLILDYRTDFTWASVKLRFDNDMSTRSGTVNKIKVQKAYLGGRVVAGDTFTLDAEIGRRSLSNAYDSKVEFGSLYDGILLRFGKAFRAIGDFYYNTGVFLIDDKQNHYGFVGEMGMLRIGNTGLNAKYSVIDWKKHFPNQQKDDRYNFVVQQLTFSYIFNPKWLGKKLIKFYGAALSNLTADDLVLFDPNDNENKRFGLQNWGWYTGVSIGTVKKAGDIAFDLNYQWVQAQTVPGFDFKGIGRGNAAGVGLYTTKSSGSGSATTTQNATGPCNYYGFEIDCLYAFTDNISVEENFKWSRTLNKHIGPNLQYQQFEVEFIYAF